MSTQRLKTEITPRSRRSWRAWLQKHHDSKTEVWLIFYKRHTGKPTVSYNDAVEEALCFGWIDGVRRSIDADRYTHRFSPRKPKSRWSALNRERAERLEKSGQMTAAGLQAMRAAQSRGTWMAAPAAAIDLSMPAELAEKLHAHGEAAKFFASLAPSYQRQFIAWIKAAKRPETKERRINEALALLARGEKLGMR